MPQKTSVTKNVRPAAAPVAGGLTASQLDRFCDLLEGKVDADAERDLILPSHHVVEQVLTQAAA